MGLPGAGKTYLAQYVLEQLQNAGKTVTWLNADDIRAKYNDWDFSDAGRLRQVLRMTHMADESDTDYVVCDFVCPTYYYRQVFDADCIVWLNTIDEGRYEDTNKLFQEPDEADYVITDWAQTDDMIANIIAAYSVNRESRMRSAAKALSWRTLGTIDTFIISYIIFSIFNNIAFKYFSR